MILPVTQISKHWCTLTKIKNYFDNPCRDDVFIMKRSKSSGLPKGVNYIFKMRGLRYVNVTIQFCSCCDQNDQMKIKSYFQSILR